jgi:hypothetical protein
MTDPRTAATVAAALRIEEQFRADLRRQPQNPELYWGIPAEVAVHAGWNAREPEIQELRRQLAEAKAENERPITHLTTRDWSSDGNGNAIHLASYRYGRRAQAEPIARLNQLVHDLASAHATADDVGFMNLYADAPDPIEWPESDYKDATPRTTPTAVLPVIVPSPVAAARDPRRMTIG